MYGWRMYVSALGLLAVAVLVALLRERARQQALGHGPEITAGRVERCRVCHDDDHASPGGAHAADLVGCSPCHLGNPLAFDADRAHAGMEPEPGALDTVRQTCGQTGCHPREADRIATSLMATGSGIIAVNRWVQGEIPTPDGAETMSALLAKTDPSPAERHLRKLCAGCHLYARRDNRDDAIIDAGVGCSACHLGSQPQRSLLDAPPHPPVDSKITDRRCLGCHSRSGRIALSYQGLAERAAGAETPCAAPTVLHDGRPACRIEADIHHDRGLACIDCHVHTELMGDGLRHAHKEDAVEISCESCHGPVAAASTDRWSQISAARFAITADLLRLRAQSPAPEAAVRRGRRGTPLWNLHATPTGWQLRSKLTGALHPVPQTPTDANHRLSGHARLTCAACHAAWAPICADCHTDYRPDGRQWDFGVAHETAGEWRERAQHSAWGSPSLAVTAEDRIVPAIPGMVATFEMPEESPAASSAGGTIRHVRLYAAIHPHTTRKSARSCASCHRSSTALGLGTGQLDLPLNGPARFLPADPDPRQPALARDAWTQLGAISPAPGTRVGLRSLDAAEQRRILNVGRCVTCHDRAADPIYAPFARALTTAGPCMP